PNLLAVVAGEPMGARRLKRGTRFPPSCLGAVPPPSLSLPPARLLIRHAIAPLAWGLGVREGGPHGCRVRPHRACAVQALLGVGAPTARVPAVSVGADTASERRTYQHRVGSASVRGH